MILHSVLNKPFCPLPNGFFTTKNEAGDLDRRPVAERLVDSEEGDANSELVARLENLVLKSAGFY